MNDVLIQLDSAAKHIDTAQAHVEENAHRY
jgi:hypothetical protein